VDIGTNLNQGDLGVTVLEIPDVGQPKVVSAEINYGTGVLKITCNETLDVTPESNVDLSLIFLSNNTGSTAMPLAGLLPNFKNWHDEVQQYRHSDSADITKTENETFSITLTEPQRVFALASSSVRGGDGKAMYLDMYENSIRDLGTIMIGNDTGNLLR
jgi:hypothetical protein